MSEHSITTTRSTPRSTDSALLGCLVAVALLFILAGPAAYAKDKEYRHVAVAEPYLELRTGPGKGYPIFHVVDRGESVDIIKQRTDWYLVRNDRDVEGWVNRSEMELTLQPDGAQLSFQLPTQQQYTDAKWELGLLAGDFGGSNSVSMYGSYSLNPHVSIEAWGSQILGNSSNGWMASVNVVHEAWPEWRVSPFFTLGAGAIRTEPKTTIVEGEDRTDQLGHVGAGIRFYAGRRFILRAEFKSYVVFTSRDENEEVEEWKVGFGYFF